jgi:adenosylmethionine-8-amino-7-oxononanoate aminotransferase
MSALPVWLQQGTPHVWRPYCQHKTAEAPLPVVDVRGSRLVLADGRELVDGIASWWTAAHGYKHPHIADRVQQQLQRVPHVAFGGLAHEAGYTLCARLAALMAPSLSKVFLLESGSVAVEVALKIALQAAAQRGQPQRRCIVAFNGAYHGDTFATMALADPVDGMHTAFANTAPFAVTHLSPSIAAENLAHIAEVLARDDVAACIIEPVVQCAGGMRFVDAALLVHLRALCSAHGVTLIFDEIATGFHRCGPAFAFEQTGVVADVVVVGKALSGGTLPLAATIASSTLFDAFLADDPLFALQHGPTYMANALACAAAHGALDLFAAQDFVVVVEQLQAKLLAGLEPLRALTAVRDVRVLGGVGVVELAPKSAPPSSTFAAHGAFVRPLRFAHADIVYVMPPLNIDDHDLPVLLAAVQRSLGI